MDVVAEQHRRAACTSQLRDHGRHEREALDHPARSHALPRRDRRDLRGLRRASCARRRRSRGACTSCTAPSRRCAPTSARSGSRSSSRRARADVVQVTERVEGEPAFLGELVDALSRSRGAPRPRVQASCSPSGRRPSGATPRRSISSRCATRSSSSTSSPSRSRTCASPRSRCPSTKTGAICSTWLLRESAARAVPVHRRRLPAQARRRRSGAHVRRRRRAGAHQQALPLRLARPAGQAAVDGVRLGHALRRGSRSSGRTSTARSATPASRSPTSTTRRSSTPASISPIRRRRCR